MHRVTRLALAGMGVWLGTSQISARAQDLPSVEQATFLNRRCAPAGAHECCPGAPPCKVIVHMSQPEIVYEDDPISACAPKAKHWRFRRDPAPAQIATVSSVLTPMSLGAGFVAQPASLSALGIAVQPSGLGAHATSLGADFSDLHSLHQMNVLAAQLRVSREIRDAQSRAQEVYAQQLQTHLSSLATQMAGNRRGSDGTQRLQPQSLNAGGDLASVNARIDALANRIDSIDARLKEVAATLQKK